MASQNKVELIVSALDRASAIFQRMGFNADQELGRVKKQADATSKSLDYIKTAAVGVVAGFGVKGAWNWLVGTNSSLEQAQIGFETMLGSAEKAKAFLGELQEFATNTPFQFAELRTAATRMLAFGFAAESVIPTLTAVGDATSGLGLGAEGVERVIVALGQIKAKAKISSDEMLQLTEAGIPAWDILSKAMGKSTAEVMRLSEKGLLPADQAIQALVNGMEERFPGMMAKMSGTLTGTLSNLGDFSEKAGAILGKGIFDQIKPSLKNALDELQRLQQSGQLEQWGKSIGESFKFAAEHADDFLAVMAGFGTLLFVTKTVEGLAVAITGLRSAEILATVATDGFTAALTRNPIGLVAVGLSVLVGGLVAYKLKTKEATDATTGLTQEKQKLLVQYRNEKAIVDSTTASDEEKVRAQSVLNEISGQIPGIISDVCRAYGQEGIEIDNVTGKITNQTAQILNNLAVKKALAQEEMMMAEHQASLLAQQEPVTEGMDFFLDSSRRSEVNETLNKTRESAAKATAEYNIYRQACEDAEAAAKSHTAALTGGSIPSFGDLGASAGEATKSLISFSSAFSSVASAVGSESGSSFIQAKEALQDIYAEATKLGATNLAAGVEQALTLLPQTIYDKTGESGQKLIWQLYELFSQAGAMSQDAAYKIVNAHDLAMAAIEDRLQQAREKAAEEARKLAEAMEDAFESAGDLYDNMVNRTRDAKQNLKDRSKDINEQLEEDLENLKEQYEETFESTKQSLANWLDLFDEAPRRHWVSASKLLRNLQNQNKQFEQFYSTLGTLAGRGVDEALIDQLRKMGPDALYQVLALNRMTDEQLAQYVAAWQDKMTMAGDEADAQLEDTREEMKDQEEQMVEDAEEELDRLREEYHEQMSEIKDDTKSQLQQMVEDAQKKGKDFMVKLLAGIKEQYPELEDIIDDITGKLVSGSKGFSGGSGGGGEVYGPTTPDDGGGGGFPDFPDSPEDWFSYHTGGQISKLGPKEVPIIAQEGELIVPAGHSVIKLGELLQRENKSLGDRIVNSIHELIQAVIEGSNVKIERLFAPENVYVNKEQDWDKVSRRLANDIMLVTLR